MSLQEPKPRKAKRVSKACDFCHSRSIRCRPSAEEGTARCQNCYDYQHPCRYTRPTLKRGTRARNDASLDDSSAGPSTSVNDQCTSQSPVGPWQAPVVASAAVITDLVHVYLDIIYPLFPLFHRESLLRRVTQAEYVAERPFFACIMALCSLAAGRVRDGAVIQPHANLDEMRRANPDAFMDAAHAAIPKDPDVTTEFDYLLCFGILAMASLQKGHIRNMQYYLGQYITVCKVNSLHMEAKWPRGLSPIEREERRRLFWSIYSLEVFSAAVFDTQVSFRESQCLVAYPLELDDATIAGLDPQGNVPPPHALNQNPPHWLHGLNFTTEIHRVMEHTIDQIRIRRSISPAPVGPLLSSHSYNKFPAIMARYDNMPAALRHVRNYTGTLDKDCYSFQAANNMVNIQMLRIHHLVAENASTEEKCSVITDLLDGFARIPVDYLRAMSTPLLFLVAGIGTAIGPFWERPLRINQYENVRSMLTALIGFLGGLESGMSFAKGGTERLRAHLKRLDDTVRNWAEATSQDGAGHMAMRAEGIGSVPPLPAAAGKAPMIYASRLGVPAGSAAVAQPNPNVPVSQDLMDDIFMSFDFADPNAMPPG